MGWQDDPVVSAPWEADPVVDDERKRQKAPNAAAQLRSQIASSIVPGSQFAPDLFMGLRSLPDAGAQLLTRGLEAVAPAGSGMESWARGQRQGVEAVNQTADAAYRQTDPENRSGSSVARAVGAAVGPGAALSVLKPASSLAGMAAQGAATGAAQGALTPVAPEADFWREKAKQTGIGAAVGGIATPLIGRALAPQTSPEARQMLDAGITPPPGQVLGGAFKSLEEASTSIPLYGEAVKAGQRRAIEQFNQAIYARTLAPLGPQAAAIGKNAPAGNEGIKKVGDTLSDAYEATLARVAPSPVSAQFKGAIAQLHGMVPQSLQDDFAKTIRSTIVDKITPGGTITASVFKDAESELGRLARSYSRSGTASERELGMAYRQAQEDLRTLVGQTNPQVAPQIQAINKGWAQLVQLERAGASVGAKDGVVSPAQYLSAVKAGDASVRHRGFARGTALNQDFAQAADAVLSKKIPDSGTPFRSMVGLAAAGAGGALNPLIPAAAGTAALGYTPLGQRALAGLLSKRPEWLRELGESAPYLAAPFTSGLLGP